MCKKCCIPSRCGYASGSWRLHASYEANSEVEQWSRNVPAHVRVNRSLRGKRGDRTRVTVPATVPTRLFSARANSMASDAGCSPAATLTRRCPRCRTFLVRADPRMFSSSPTADAPDGSVSRTANIKPTLRAILQMINEDRFIKSIVIL